MTRQWLADPSQMCMQHLTGEHAETHMFLRKMEKGYSLKGFIDGYMFFGAKFLKERHDFIALFLKGHKTPLEIGATEYDNYPEVPITLTGIGVSLSTLLDRCEDCYNKTYRPRFES